MVKEKSEKQTKDTEKQAKDIVKEIFGKSTSRPKKISTIFTHFRRPPKAPSRTKASLFLKKFPAAIDIGASSIKIIQLAQRQPKGELEVVCIDKEEYSIHTLAGTSGKVPEIIDQREALGKLIERNDIGHEVVASISASDTQIYNLIFPQMSEGELNNAIRLKVTQLRPFGLGVDAIVYGFIKGENLVRASSTQIKILLICVSRELIRSRTLLLQDLGLKPMAIEVAPMALANLDKFRKQPSGKEEIVLWLNLGAQESALTITQGGSLCFCRVLAITSNHMTKQIAQHSHVSEEEAEEAKKEYGLSFWAPDKTVSVFVEPEKSPQGPEDKSAEVYRSLISSLENFVVDISHSFKYFSYQVTQSQVTKFDLLMLSGGGTKLKKLDGFLSSRLGTPVEKVDPFSFFKISESIREQKANFLAQASEFTIAAALAIGPKIDPGKRVDLIPREKKKGLEFIKEHLRDRSVKVAISVLAAAVILIVFQIGRAASYKWKMDSVNKEVKVAQNQLSTLQSQQLKLAQEEAQFLEKKIKLNERLIFLRGATRRPESFSEVFAEVANLLPEDIWITKLAYLEDKININGSTSNIQVVMELIETLKKSDNFVSVTFTYTQRDVSKNSDVYSFEIIAQMRI